METPTKSRLWFKRKRYGYGWTPSTWQGFLAVAIYLAAVVFLVSRVEDGMTLMEVTQNLFIPLGVLVTSLLIVCYKKGEKPRWQWGEDQA